MELVKYAPSWKKLLRIRFFRSIKTELHANNITVADVIVCCEFNETSIQWTNNIELSAHIRKHEGRSIDSSIINEFAMKLSVSRVQSSSPSNDSYLRVRFRAPADTGYYSMLLTGVFADESIYIMPLLSDVFAVNELSSDGSTYIPPMLSSYRVVPLQYIQRINKISSEDECIPCAAKESSSIIVKEEYGATLGSHVYDSAVVLLKTLLLQCDVGEPCDVVLELGAGCGLTGIGLVAANYSKKCIVSDQPNQMALLSDNIALNQMNEMVDSLALDWNDENALNELYHQLNGTLNVIIAADVFYDNEVARSFFRAIDKLMIIGKTIVYAAQKVRRGEIMSSSAVNNEEYSNIVREILAEFPLLCNYEVIHQEADVVIWRIFKAES